MHIVTTSDPMLAARYIADRIIANLSEGKKVLWFIPGGSCIPVAVKAAEYIIASGVAYNGLLSVTLTDERFGAVGHADSNWHQLLDAGFSLPDATLIPVLTPASATTSRDVVAQVWGKALLDALLFSNYNLGFFGIGPDGHIAGMLPHTSSLMSRELTDSYSTEKFERITITPLMVHKMTEVVAFATGSAKLPTLKKLRDENVSITEQPAQLLKVAEKCTLFTDVL